MAERLMKDSGVEWIGEIPQEWSLVNLRHFIKEYKTGPFGSTLRIDKILTEGELFVDALIYSPEHIAKRDFYLNSNTFISKEREEELSQFFVEENDIIFPIVGTLGRSMEITKEMPRGIINSRLGKFKLDTETLNKNYFMWLFSKSDFYKTYIDLNSHGAIIVNLTREMFCNMPVPVPTIEEQAHIADFLDKKASEIDAVISKTKESIEEYKKLKQSIITEAVTKGLDPNVEMKDSGVEWIRKIPSQWEIKKLKMLFSFGKGLPITKDNLTETGIKVISYGQIHAKWNTGVSLDERIFRYVPVQYSIDYPSTKVNKGDFIFADTSEDLEGCGNNIYIDRDDDIYAGYHAITMHSLSGNDNKYLAYLFKNNDWRIQVRAGSEGVKLCSISKKNLKNATVILPSKTEQTLIVEYLDSQCSKYDDLIAKKEQVITELEQYKKSLIYEYVTGKKEVA